MNKSDLKHVFGGHKTPTIDGFSTPQARTHYPPHLDLEPTHLDIHLDVKIEKKTMAAQVILTFQARSATNKLVLDAIDLQNVKVEDLDGKKVRTQVKEKNIVIHWEEKFSVGDVGKVKLSYEVIDPITGLYFSSPDDKYPSKSVFAATDNETERARYWLPTIDQPAVRTPLDFHIRSKQHLTILANGFENGVDLHDDGTKTVHWKLEQKCPSYLACFVVGELTCCDDGEFEGIPLKYFADKKFREEDLRRSFGRTGEMMAWMTKKLDMAFPYPKYYQFCVQGIGGAMENISLVSWDEYYVCDEIWAQDWGRLVDQINVHEMAHSYFGDTVVCHEHAHAWLKEAWATYIESCWLEDTLGADEQQYNLYVDKKYYMEEADDCYARPMVIRQYDSSFDLYDEHLYPGGALRLHTLRNVVGDDAFWSATQDYLATYSEKTVETDDFRRMMEKHSGKSLVEFFDQWIYSPGYPDLEVTFEYDEEDKTGTFCFTQKQVDSKKQKPFRLSLDLLWEEGNKKQSKSIELFRESHEFTLPMEQEPHVVRIDPEVKVLCNLRFHPGDSILLRQLTDAPDVVGRILAAKELAKKGKRKSLQTIEESYAKEPFWGVRREMAEAVISCGNQYAVDAAIKMLQQESEPAVLRIICMELCSLKAESVRDAIKAKIQQEKLPYLTLGSALKALGSQRNEEDLSFITEFLQSDRFFHGIGEGTAYQGVAEIRSKEAFQFLHRQCSYGNIQSPYARRRCIEALGSLGSFMEKKEQEQAYEQLVQLLRETEEIITISTASGLGKLGHPEAIDKLESVRNRLPTQWQTRFIDPVIKKLLKGKSPDIGKLESKIEELLKEQRKLNKRIDYLEDKESTN